MNIDCCRFFSADSSALHPLSGMAPTLILIKYLLMHHCKRLLAATTSSHEWRLSAASIRLSPLPATSNHRLVLDCDWELVRVLLALNFMD